MTEHNIVGVDREFPANIYPWMGLKRRNVELRLYRPDQGRIDVRALLRLCDRRTRVLAISAVQFWSGFRTDLSALSTGLKGRDVLLVVSACPQDLVPISGADAPPRQVDLYTD